MARRAYLVLQNHITINYAVHASCIFRDSVVIEGKCLHNIYDVHKSGPLPGVGLGLGGGQLTPTPTPPAGVHFKKHTIVY